jgi:ABC-type xylose transport system substrate-binding protein
MENFKNLIFIFILFITKMYSVSKIIAAANAIQNENSPKYVTFDDVRVGIIKAKKASPLCKKFAWSQVFKISETYKKQELSIIRKVINQDYEDIDF